jgi:hypothetical protein
MAPSPPDAGEESGYEAQTVAQQCDLDARGGVLVERFAPLSGPPLDAEPDETASAGEIRCRSGGPARIKRVMASSAQSAARVRHVSLPLVRRGSSRWLVRAPGRRGAWSPEEVAHALNERRPELRGAVERRQDARGVPAGVREEIVDEAIGLVVMSREPVRNEQHLLGAFWSSVGFLLAECRAGRHGLRVGSRKRVELDLLAVRVPDGSEPFDLVALRERFAKAADWMAQLDPFERRVVALMATRGLGVKLAAQALGEPVKTVLAAARSADRKLEQIAAIAAAGRMCEYRQPAIIAYAEGDAQARQEQRARAHLAACAWCPRFYAQLLREMGSRDFQRAASAAFLPPPIAVAGGHGWVERLAGLFPHGRMPSTGATGERAAGLLGGGGGVVKAAAAGTALVIAGAGVGERVIHSLSSPHHTPHHHVARHAGPSAAQASIRPATLAAPHNAADHRVVARRAAVRRGPAPPSRDLGYLALGQSAGGASSPPRAEAASTTHRASSGEEGPPPRPTQTGGGTSLNYLGH